MKYGSYLSMGFFLLTSPARLVLADNVNSPFPALLERAKAFEELGLIALARGEYQYMSAVYPKEQSVEGAIKNLTEKETKIQMQEALYNKNLGAFSVSLTHVERALAASPDFPPAKEMKAELLREISMKKGLQEKTSRDYLQGINCYEAGKWDRALESFVKVLNMDPGHKGALSYIEKVGQRMNVGVSQ